MKIGTRYSRVVNVHLSKQPVPDDTKKLPWPRLSDDGTTQVGIDVVAKYNDIIKIVYKYFKIPEISMDELLQEVFLTIIHKNHSQSAHNPLKSSFGHYVYMIANNVCINLVHKKERYDKERDSLDAPCKGDDTRILLDTIEVPEDIPDDLELDEKLDELEIQMRYNGRWDLARFIGAVRSGADLEIVRDALTWGGRKITNKVIRDYKSQIREMI